MISFSSNVKNMSQVINFQWQILHTNSDRSQLPVKNYINKKVNRSVKLLHEQIKNSRYTSKLITNIIDITPCHQHTCRCFSMQKR